MSGENVGISGAMTRGAQKCDSWQHTHIYLS